MSAMPMETPPPATQQPKPLKRSRTIYATIATMILALIAAVGGEDVVDLVGRDRLLELLIVGVAASIAFLRAAVARAEGASASPTQGRTPPPAAMIALAALPFLGGCESYPDTRPTVAALDATISRLEADYRGGAMVLREDPEENAEALESRLSLIDKAHESARIALEAGDE